MKRSRIIVFIFSIIAVLGLLCLVFPKDGIGIGSMRLTFPALSDMLYASDDSVAVEPVIRPENRPESRQESRRERRQERRQERQKPSEERLAELAAQEKPFLDFMQNDPTRFSLPDGDVRFFDRFFEHLENASKEPMRVIHYGDSQIEEDRITSKLRTRLQERFGGKGPGFLPLRKYYTSSIGVSTSRELRRFMVFGDKSMRASDNRYGPYATFVRMDTAVSVSFAVPKNKIGNGTFFDRATLVAGNVRGGLTAAGADSSYRVSPGNPIELLNFELADSTVKFSLRLSGHADLYGMLLDGRSGVSVDNVAMRGCSGSVFTSMDDAQLSGFYEKANVKMIMLQYGGNSVPYIRSDKALQTYVQSLGKQIAHVRSLAPDATIVFIGPSDMSTNVGGKRVTYPMLPALVDSLRAKANENGAAYWSIYDAMGGNGSMASWVKANPALASSDYIHFTSRGAAMMGDLLTDALMKYYEYYRWRKDNE